MHTHQIQLKHSPRTVTVGKQTITIDGTSRADNTSKVTTPVTTTATGTAVTPRAKSASVATVIANPIDRAVTPLSRSSAVPVLSNAAQAVVTAAEVGLGGIDPERRHDDWRSDGVSVLPQQVLQARTGPREND